MTMGGFNIYGIVLMTCSVVFHTADGGITLNETRKLRDKALEMFDHAYNSYMANAFPADELMPLTCQGRYRGSKPSRGDVDESLGNFTLTLVDTLDTLAVLGKLEEFESALRLVIENTSFETDVVVSVFETNIRMLGGLLGGHVMAVDLQQQGKCCQWYKDELLKKALDLGERLLPAFDTSSGIPYPKVNLKLGLKGLYMKDTCTACAGTMVLEFAALSRLTGDNRFEEAAHKAMDFLWNQRNIQSNLMGTVLNVQSGDWVRRESGIGAGIDSYYEYLLKAYILLGETVYLQRFNKHYDAVMTYISRGPLMLNVDMHKPTVSGRNIMDALLAFWPGLQVLKGDLKSAIEMHEVLYQITQRHNFLPEAVTTDFHVHWAQHPLRPEFVESTYFLYKATNDPHYLEVGKSVLENLEKHARVACGFAAIKDVRAGSHEDQMDSFVLAETFKYLYLLFEEESKLTIDLSQYIFTTEAHLLPLSLANYSALTNKPNLPSFDESAQHSRVHHDHSCPNVRSYKGISTIRYAEMIRSPLKDYVELKCPKPKPSRLPRLRASEFSAQDAKQSKILNSMGVELSMTSDGRIQLVHSPNKAESADLAEEGLAFMKDMLELAQNAKEQPPDPRVVQVIAPGKSSTIIFQAGSSQFGWDFNPPKNGKSILKAFKDGIRAQAVRADPFTACKELENGDVVSGKICITTRGSCTFIDKARRCQKHGGIGIITIDNTVESTSAKAPFFQMSGDGVEDVTIPAVFLYSLEGKSLLSHIEQDSQTEVYIARRKLQDKEFKESSSPRTIILTGQSQLTIHMEFPTFQISVNLQVEVPTTVEDKLADAVSVNIDAKAVGDSSDTKPYLMLTAAKILTSSGESQIPKQSDVFEVLTDVLYNYLQNCETEISSMEEQMQLITGVMNHLGVIYEETDSDELYLSLDQERVHQLIEVVEACENDQASLDDRKSEQNEPDASSDDTASPPDGVASNLDVKSSLASDSRASTGDTPSHFVSEEESLSTLHPPVEAVPEEVVEQHIQEVAPENERSGSYQSAQIVDEQNNNKNNNLQDNNRDTPLSSPSEPSANDNVIENVKDEL